MSNRVPHSSRPDLAEQKRVIEINQDDLRIPPSTRKAVWAFFETRIADLLTLSRAFLGLFLVWSGLVDGRAALSQDIWILVMGWSTDMIDGRISRSLKTNNRTWLGKNDVYVDMFFSAAVMVYLVVTGLLALWVMLLYLLLWSAPIWRWGIPPIFAQAFQNPIYAYFVFLTVQDSPSVIPWLLLWALVALLLFRSRMFELLRGIFKGSD